LLYWQAQGTPVKNPPGKVSEIAKVQIFSKFYFSILFDLEIHVLV